MLLDVEQMAKDAICPHCEAEGDFAVLMNFSFREKECTITCECNHCHSTFEVESISMYSMVKTQISDAA